ncbi:hypothetical protein CH330_01585 [candidate division WOR-3 bacterium JGI_Cruoil_03_51_56]|uniref:R3H domain-containing protein n=1 Tax=candidate division WOR-3 bacterium JGI_Cruoil_03_51_56 TaxID=1973747 RepID=A0A235BWW9_UNCW3|nr:MAG: hypothetical protein CH330_01585 [candidate division WOR-3 bacterium JGI_Cruoil_03_51_56]
MAQNETGERPVSGNGPTEVTQQPQKGPTPESVPAQVEKTKPDEPTAVRQTLQKLVNMVGIKAKIEVTERENAYYANIKARHSNGLLIGHRGGTLRSLQYLTRLIVKQEYPNALPITVDVSGYRLRRENFLRKKATAVARIVLETQREMALDLLTEKEMEIVRQALKPMAGIRVYALGTGTRRNVIIAPIAES